jgi:hypothetical protein
VLTLTSYSPLDTPTLNLDRKMKKILFGGRGQAAYRNMLPFPPFWSILRKRTFLGKVVLESLVVLAIVISHVILPHPFEPPFLYGC